MTADNNKPPKIDMAEIMAQMSARHARIAEIVPVNKAKVVAALAAAGITTVTVKFDGYGDSGQIESVEAEAGEASVDLPDVSVEVSRTSYNSDEIGVAPEPLAQAIESLCYDALEARHDGWEINEGAFGEFVIDVTAGTISLDFNYRVEATEHHSHEF